MIVKNELESKCKEMVKNYFKILDQNSSRGTEETPWKTQVKTADLSAKNCTQELSNMIEAMAPYACWMLWSYWYKFEKLFLLQGLINYIWIAM